MLGNDERQKRFRKMEALKKYANEVYIKKTMSAKPSRFGKGMELKKYIDNIVNLPSKWCEDDYDNAVKKLNEIDLEYYENEHLLDNDITSCFDIITAPNPRKLLEEHNSVKIKSREILDLILTIFRIAGIKDVYAPSILMELMRDYGRRLVMNDKTSVNYANAFAISFVGRQYNKPNWVKEKVLEYLLMQNNDFADENNNICNKGEKYNESN